MLLFRADALDVSRQSTARISTSLFGLDKQFGVTALGEVKDAIPSPEDRARAGPWLVDLPYEASFQSSVFAHYSKTYQISMY